MHHVIAVSYKYISVAVQTIKPGYIINKTEKSLTKNPLRNCAELNFVC